jgi:hypothetical protein
MQPPNWNAGYKISPPALFLRLSVRQSKLFRQSSYESTRNWILLTRQSAMANFLGWQWKPACLGSRIPVPAIKGADRKGALISRDMCLNGMSDKRYANSKTFCSFPEYPRQFPKQFFKKLKKNSEMHQSVLAIYFCSIKQNREAILVRHHRHYRKNRFTAERSDNRSYSFVLLVSAADL